LVIPTIKCVLCEKEKPQTVEYWNKYHILPYAFGNDGVTDAILIDKICMGCNSSLEKCIERPFLRAINSRSIEGLYGMMRRKKKGERKITGGSVFVKYNTITAHIFLCIKIAFETHIKFLDHTYRSEIFHILRKLLLSTMQQCDDLRANHTIKSNYNFDYFWADSGQTLVATNHFNDINKYVHKLSAVSTNSDEVIKSMALRSKHGSYASLIQLGSWNFGIAVTICLQSMVPLVIIVSDDNNKYIKEYGRTCIHYMDLRSNAKLVGCECDMYIKS